MEGSDVVGPTGGTIGVTWRVVEVASGMGTGGAKVGDAGVGGIVFVRNSPCSVYGGTRGATI